LSSSGTTGIGEAPQLSPTYGEYDDGASVFSLYSNFYDTLAGYYVYNLKGDSNYFVPTPTTSPYNSVELMDNSYHSGAYILSPNNISLGNYILQTYWSYSGSADGFSVSLWGNPNTTYSGGGGYSPGMSGGLTYHYEFYSGGGTPPGGDPNAASVFSLTGYNAGTLITGAPAEGEGNYYVYSQIAFYNIGSDSGTVALYSSATTNISTPNNITPAELYSPTYQSIASFSSIPLSASPILFGAGTGDATSYVYIYWALMRAYPPNGVMPSVSFGSVSYRVTFTESGLPSGYWYVNITGQPSSGPIPSSQASYSVFLPNGTYSFTVSTGNKEYKPIPSSGSFTVNGASVSESITFSEVTYTVTFTESGLPSGTQWSVTLNGTTKSSTTNTISFTEPNGTYSFSISSINGYSVSPSSGSITVNGASVNQAITFKAVTPSIYTVTFTESGLPSGTQWSVTLNGTTKSSTTITFTVPNGEYNYSVASPILVNGVEYVAAEPSGTVTVNNTNVTITVHYVPVTPPPPSSSSLTVQVFNVLGRPATTVPGVVFGVLYNSSFKEVTYMNSSGYLNFNNIDPGTYTLEVYHYPNTGLNYAEYWGSETINVQPGYNTANFTRDEPWIYDLQPVYGNGQVVIITIDNPLSTTLSAYVYLWVTTNPSTAKPKPTATQPITIHPGLNEYTFYYPASETGTHYVYAALLTYNGTQYMVTDQWNWITIQPKPTPNAVLTWVVAIVVSAIVIIAILMRMRSSGSRSSGSAETYILRKLDSKRPNNPVIVFRIRHGGAQVFKRLHLCEIKYSH